MACSTLMKFEDSAFSSELDVLALFTRMMNSRSTFLASHYLSNDVVLDWFGRTIVGKINVLNFLFEETHLSEHDVVQVKTRGELENNALERALGRFRQPSPSEKEGDFDGDDDSGFVSGSFELSDSSFSSSNSDTPASRLAADLPRLALTKPKEIAMDLRPTTTPIYINNPSPVHLKRPSAALRSLKLIDVPSNLQVIDAAGIISFSSEEEPFTPCRRWSQRCHLQLGYYHIPCLENSLRFTFLTYHDDMPCRRNLTRIFEQCV